MSDASPSSLARVTFSSRGLVRGAQRLLPVSVFVFPFGVAFGAAAIETGLTPDQALMMSFLVFAGASQFAALDLWQSPLPYLSLALMVLAVNGRHIILGASIARYVNHLPSHHWLGALALLSEANFADSYKAMKDGERDAGLLLGGGLIMWAVWAVATAIGVFAGALLGDLERFGVDVVMAAFFAALALGMVPTWRKAVPVAVACLVAVITLPLLPAGWNVIAAALAGGLVGAFDLKQFEAARCD